jgi:hypothetical protein
MAEIYYSGQGAVYISDRDVNGNPGVFRDMGNVAALKVTLETDVLEHKESRTGSRLTDLRLIKERKATVSITMESFNKKNLVMMLYGSSQVDTTASVTNEISPAGLAVGDMIALAHPFLTAPPVINTNPAGTLWVLNTDYTYDATAGMITIVSISKGTRIETDYTYATVDVVPMFEAPQVERYMRFAGLNTANANKPVTVELYRVVFDPVGNVDLINDDLVQFELTGSVLYDSGRDTTSGTDLYGGFGRVVQT